MSATQLPVWKTEPPEDYNTRTGEVNQLVVFIPPGPWVEPTAAGKMNGKVDPFISEGAIHTIPLRNAGRYVTLNNYYGHKWVFMELKDFQVWKTAIEKAFAASIPASSVNKADQLLDQLAQTKMKVSQALDILKTV